MSADTNIEGEGCRRCDRLEDQLEAAEKQVKTMRAQLRESGEYRDGLAAKIIELEGLLRNQVMSDGEQKSTALGVTHSIDSHIKSRNTYGEALRDLVMIYEHVEQRLAHLKEFYVPESSAPSLTNQE